MKKTAMQGILLEKA